MHAPADRASLKRVLTLRHLVFYGIVCITPIAPLPLFGITQQLSKGHAIVPVLLAMLAMGLTAISYGRMAGRYPAAGSAYTYVGKTLNTELGTLTGWLMCLDYGLIPLINVLYASLTLNQLLPAVPFQLWILVIGAAITVLNLRGMESTSGANDVLLGIMFVVLAAFVAAAIYALARTPHVAWAAPFYTPATFNWRAIATATSFTALTYIGFDAVTTLSEDAIRPRRDVPLATVLTCVFTGVAGGIPVYLGQLLLPDFTKFAVPETAFLDVARAAGGNILYQAMAIVFLLAALGSALAGQAGAARLLFAMGREQVLPRKWFGTIGNSGRVPAFNLLVIGAAAVAGSFLLSFEHAAELLNFGAFLGFIGVNAAAFRAFYQNAVPGERSLFRDAAPPLIGILFCLAIFVSLPRPALITGTLWLLLGVCLVAFRRWSGSSRLLPEDAKSTTD